MKQNLYKRGSIFYLRINFGRKDVKVSLCTKDYYEAQQLRDAIMDKSRLIEAKEFFNQYGSSQDLKQVVRTIQSIVAEERSKNKGKLPESFRSSVGAYTDSHIKIKDQEYLEHMLQCVVGVIESERMRNGGILPEYLVNDLATLANPENLKEKTSPEQRELQKEVNGIFNCTDFITDKWYRLKDVVEYNQAYNEGVFNIALAYLGKHYTPPTTPATTETLLQLIAAGKLPNERTPQPATIFNKSFSETRPTQEVIPHNVAASALSNNLMTSQDVPHVTLQQIIDEYLIEKRAGTDANEGTIEGIKIVLDLVLEFFGPDTDINRVNERNWILEYKALVKRLPRHRNKSKFKDIPVRELVEMKHKNTLDIDTYNKYLRYLNAVMTHAERRDYIIKIKTYDLQDKNKKTARSQNDCFEEDDLVTLFSELHRKYGQRKNQEMFWIPLVSLFTSGRLNEVCQLTRHDVRLIDDVWCIDINDQCDDPKYMKAIKNKNSERIIPIHNTLIELGLLKYLNSLKTAKTANVWKLKYGTDKDKYSRGVGRSFSSIRKDLLNPPPRKKTFHSLRHTFITEFSNFTAADNVVYCAGHSTGIQTFDRYKKYKPVTLKVEVDKLKFPPKVELMFQEWIKEHNKK